MKKRLHIVLGFIALFFVYHFPEFFNSFLLSAIFKIGFLVFAIFLAKLQGFSGLSAYGLPFNNSWLKNVLIGLLIGTTFFTLSVILSYLLKFDTIDKVENFNFFLQSLPLTMLMTFFPSIAEDILTRGYLWGHFKYLKPGVWIILSAIVYVLNHIWRLDDGFSVLSYLFFLGLVLAICIFISNSLWLTLGIHWGSNIAFELINSGVKSTLLVEKYYSILCLTATWAFLLFILIIIFKNKLRVNKAITGK